MGLLGRAGTEPRSVSVNHFRTISFLSLAALTSSGMSPVNPGTSAIIGPARPAAGQAAPAHDVSILTYNIEGLPWPLAVGRPAAFIAIENRLRELRSSGRQPQVLVLQEAFTRQAKAVGANSGYPFVAMGGATTDLRDSGLEIASD